MNWSTTRKCPCCQETNWNPKEFLIKDHFLTLEGFSIGHCLSCDFKMTVNAPEQSDIGRYYASNEYISHSNTSRGIISSLYQRSRRVMLRQKQRWIEGHTSEVGRLLDIGAGTGHFAAHMKEAGWKVDGLEPDEGARQIAKNEHDITLQEPSVLYSLSSTYEVITLWHVLEHIHDLEGYIEKIHNLLSLEGILVIAVPNYTSLDAEIYGSQWAAYDVPRHLWHFSPQSMQTLMARHGFDIVKKYRMKLDPFYVSLLSEKYKGRSLRLLRGFWTGLRSHFASLGNLDRSSSIVYVMQLHSQNPKK